ncbi:MAG: ABC transporter permease [Bacillales bacterium]|jgi:ABC-type dipeptide/oligopeptide/nickel transport system permease subunit|nr:ABC transporter permease [Bacillales bacterium]
MNNEIKQYSDELFQRVQINEKIFDQKFEGKPRSFLADAMLRFVKNKINIVATSIVFVMVVLSFLVPLLTTRDFTSANNAKLQYMPPRVPILENFGILDGKVKVNDFPTDSNKPELDKEGNPTGRYYPLFENINKYSSEYIVPGSLENSESIGGVKRPEYVGGTNYIRLLANTDAHSILSPETRLVFLQRVEIVVDSMDPDSTLTLLFKPKNIDYHGLDAKDPASFQYYRSEFKLRENGEESEDYINTITSPGTYLFRYSFVKEAGDETDYNDGQLCLNFESPIDKARIDITSVNIMSSDTTVVTGFSGYELSQWSGQSIDGYGGDFLRANAIFTSCSFTYDKYAAIFAPVPNQNLAESKYLEILSKNPDMEEAIVYNDPDDHSKGWVFEGEWPIIEITGISPGAVGPDGVYHFSYKATLRGTYVLGFDIMPYFLFGTDSAGRDLFAQVWLSLRTSLLLGVIVSVINIIIGVIWGSISGYYGGAVDFSMERFCEYLGSFPGLTVLSILYLKWGAGLLLMLVYLTYSGWIGVAGITRIQFYRYRGREYVLASRTLGAKDSRLIFKHILPNGIGIIITRTILSIPGMILTEASLSYLNFGFGHGTMLDFGLFKLPGLSLGVILFEGQQVITKPGVFYLVMIPAVVIIILMISFNLFGNALRDAMNPSLRGQE